jgi:hypothetical protein
MAMFEAVQTRTSTFGIWAIIVVAVVCLAVWLVGISVADNMQARESRRWWQRLHGPQPALGSPERALGTTEPAVGGAGPLPVPGQRRGDVRGAGRSAASQEAGAGQEAVTEPIPAQGPAPEPETVAEGGRHARPTLDGAGDFRRDSAEAHWRTEPPTRPDLPAQAAAPGRHAMPTQRTGEADRAERSLAGPDPARPDEDPSQQ